MASFSEYVNSLNPAIRLQCEEATGVAPSDDVGYSTWGISASGTASSADGLHGKGLQFDAGRIFCDRSTFTKLGATGSFTIALSLKVLTQADTWPRVFTTGTTDGRKFVIVVGTTTGSERLITFHVEDDSTGKNEVATAVAIAADARVSIIARWDNDSETADLWVDTERAAAVTAQTWTYPSDGYVYIGARSTSGNELDGIMDEFLFWDSALPNEVVESLINAYAGTVPDFTTIPDPFWSNVELLLDLESVSAVEDIADLSDTGNTVSAGGSAGLSIDNSHSKFGDSSVAFPDDQGYLHIETDLLASNQDWTLEMWMRVDRGGSTPFDFICSGEDTGGVQRCINLQSTYLYKFEWEGTSSDYDIDANIVSGEWFHFCVEHNSVTGTVNFYINGIRSTLVITTYDNVDMEGLDFYIGARPFASAGMNGNVAHVRFTKGIMRYGISFTPPTEVFPQPVGITYETVEDKVKEYAGLFFAWLNETATPSEDKIASISATWGANLSGSAEGPSTDDNALTRSIDSGATQSNMLFIDSTEVPVSWRTLGEVDSDFTVGFWVKTSISPSSGTNWRSEPTFFELRKQQGSGAHVLFNIGCDTDGKIQFGHAWNYTTGAQRVKADGLIPVNDDQWHFICFTRSAGEIVAYVDDSTETLSCTNGDTSIGSSTANLVVFSRTTDAGAIDDALLNSSMAGLFICSRKLTALEVEDIRQYSLEAVATGISSLKIAGTVLLNLQPVQADLFLLESVTFDKKAITQSNAIDGSFDFTHNIGEGGGEPIMESDKEYFVGCHYGEGIRPLIHGPVAPEQIGV